MFPAGAALVVLEMFLVLLGIVHGGKLCFTGRGLAITSGGHLRPRNRLGMVGEDKNRGGLFDEEDAVDEYCGISEWTEMDETKRNFRHHEYLKIFAKKCQTWKNFLSIFRNGKYSKFKINNVTMYFVYNSL